MITDQCGFHCGIKDGYEGHCPCPWCHVTEETETPVPDDDEHQIHKIAAERFRTWDR